MGLVSCLQNVFFGTEFSVFCLSYKTLCHYKIWHRWSYSTLAILFCFLGSKYFWIIWLSVFWFWAYLLGRVVHIQFEIYAFINLW